MIKITVTENQGNQRLDRFLKKYFDNAPLSYIYRIIRKDVKVNGKRCRQDFVLKSGDELSIYIGTDQIADLQSEKKRVKVKRQFKIAYEDDNILVAEKPFGLLTHGDRAEKKNHLANQVVDYLIDKGEYSHRLEKTFSPSPVNRLDRNTTGLVVFGKNAVSLQELNHMIREKDAIRKLYLTIVSGKLTDEIHMKAKMTKDERINKVDVLDENAEEGKEMETIARPVKSARFDGRWYTLAEVEIITGRTHQIRAHLAKAGFPVIGDVKYGIPAVNKKMKEYFGLSTQLLHAYRIIFERCSDMKNLSYLQGRTVDADIPEDFNSIKKAIFGKNKEVKIQ